MSTRRILAVDDELQSLKLLHQILTMLDDVVVVAAIDGVQALDFADSSPFDLVITDMKMPGMDGLELIRRLKAHNREIPVVVLTGFPDVRNAVESMKLGAAEYLSKPFEKEELLGLVEALLSGEAPAGAPPPAADTGTNTTKHKLGQKTAPDSTTRIRPSPEPAQATGLMARVQSLGPYKLVRHIESGAMAEVYEARDKRLNRKVAVKVLRPEYNADTEFVGRFLREGEAIAKVNHPNVVQVFAAGTEHGCNYLAMEFLDGSDLWKVVSADGPLAVWQAVNFIAQAARGLQAALAEGVIHRDVKPENLMRDAADAIKVTDFGVAKLLDKFDGLTTYSHVLGTPTYMAPEQAEGRPADHRADLYSLGATLYFLLTGAAPFSGSNPVEVMMRHATEPIPRVPKVSGSVNRLIARLTAKDADERMPDYDGLFKEVERIEREDSGRHAR